MGAGVRSKRFIWPMLRFWEDTPLQWFSKAVWNTSEILRVPLPFAPFIFGLIMGKPGKKVKEIP